MIVGPGRALAQRPLGIDVSSYQGGSINWTSVKSSGITFAWAKAAEATPSDGYIDPDADFTVNMQNAKAAGVPIGAYYFAHPELDVGLSGADTEAAYFWSVISSYITTNGHCYLMPSLDFEQDVTTANPAYTADTLSQWVNEWCQDVVNDAKAKGVVLTPVVYTYTSYAAGTSGHGPGLDISVTQWPLWMASPDGQSVQTGGPSATSPWSTWSLWQYGQADVSGITTGAVDEDTFDGTSTQLTNSLIIGVATAPQPPSAITNFWDVGLKNASPGSGGTGMWNNSTANWWLNGTGDIPWSTAGDYAVFAGTAGTVTLGANVAADSLTFSNGGYVIAGSDTLTMVGPAKFVVPKGTTNSIECVLGGAAFNLSGGGVLYLNNANNYSAGENVIGPNTTLQLPTDHPSGNDGVTVNLSNGGIYQDLDATSGDQFLLPGCAVALLTGGGIFSNPGGNLTMTNRITGSGSLTIAGTTYTLTLTDTANNYTGGTIVQSGELKASAAGVLGSTSGALTVSGGTLDLGTASQTVGAVTISSGTIQDGTLTGTSYACQGGTVSAVLAGSAAMTKSTTNTLTLSGANTYTGINTISLGLLQISADANLGAAPASVVTNQITLNSGTTNNYGLRTTASFTLNSNRGITLGTNGGAIQVAGGDVLTYGGVITGSGNFEAGTGITVGYGTLILNNTNNYKGTTTIAAGTVQLGINGALPYGTPLTIAAADSVGGILNLNGHSQTIGPLASSTGIGGIGTDIPTVVLSGALTVIETNNTVFAGTISGIGGSLTLNGGSTLTLNGTNTHTGPTIISAGTLALGSNGSISNTASISLAAGATLDVSAIASYTLGGSTALSAAGTSTPATINGGNTVSLGSQPITLAYDGSHPALSISQGTLSLNGNSFTVNGPALAPGTYTLIQQASGSVASSGTFAVSGTAIGAGTTGAIVVSGGNVNLMVESVAGFSNLASQSTTYGSASVTLNGTVSGSGPIYPANGETVTVTINGNAQTTTINDSTGDFSINYNPSTLPASGTPYAISYSYVGDGSLTAASITNTTLTVNALPVVLSGTRPFDGTAAAAAAILSVMNPVGSDVVTVASGSATLVSTNVGPEPILSVGTLALGGPAAANYTLAGASGTVIITATSVPPFSITSGAVDVTGTNFVMTWQSVPGATYLVVGSTNLTAVFSNWAIVAGPITATSSTTSATNPITSPMEFFDVESP